MVARVSLIVARVFLWVAPGETMSVFSMLQTRAA